MKSKKRNAELTAVCAREECLNRVSGHKKYCSRSCSTHVRNPRYYCTLRGRLNKRAAQSRYFQKYRQELYAKRKARMQRYFAQVIQTDRADPLVGQLIQWNRKGLSEREYSEVAARHLVRVQHDWHPQQLRDTPLGRPLYMLDFESGGMVLRSPHEQREARRWFLQRNRKGFLPNLALPAGVA